MTNIATFNTAGVSRQYGKLKIRMANDIEWRQFMLKHEGHTDIQLIAFGQQLPKTELLQLAMAHTTVVDGVEAPTFGAEAQDCFVKYLQSVGVIDKPKLKRGRKAKAEADVAEAAEPQQLDTAADVAAEAPTEALVEAVKLTLEGIPKRDAKGRLLSGESRKQMLADMLGVVALATNPPAYTTDWRVSSPPVIFFLSVSANGQTPVPSPTSLARRHLSFSMSRSGRQPRKEKKRTQNNACKAD